MNGFRENYAKMYHHGAVVPEQFHQLFLLYGGIIVHFLLKL